MKKQSKILRDRFKFCVNSKTDIRFVNSYKWADPDFLVLPLSVLYREFYHCPCSFKKNPFTDFCQSDVPQSKSPAGNESAPSPDGVPSISL